jgi:DNA (cytosine-5)-methyltransferase 1
MTTQYLSVCSGIEAASVAWHPLGWKPLAFAEIEAFPRAVLEHRWPGVPVHGDFTRLRDETWIVDADVLVGGTPCQAFSVAGKRASLADDRGNLTLEFVRLAEAIDDGRRLEGRDPSILIWENVPGVLSVKDNAFGCFLAALAGEDEALVPPRGKWANAGVVVGPQRSVAWRILDAQYFGVAQRRRRVFVVASARDGFNPAEVLLEWEGVRRDTPPSREAGEAAPGSAGPSAAGGGDVPLTEAFGGNNTAGPIDVATALNACGTASGRQDFESETFIAQVAGTLGAGGTKAKSAGTATTQDAAAGMLVAHSLRGEGFDASEDGTGRGTPLVPVMHVDLMPTMTSGGPSASSHNQTSGQMREQYIVPMAAPIAFHPTQDPISSADGSTHTLSSGSKRGTATVAVAFAQNTRDEVRLMNGDGGIVGALSAEPGMKQTCYVAFSAKDHGSDAGDVAPTLRAMGHGASHANGGGQVAVAFDIHGVPATAGATQTDVHTSLRARAPGGSEASTTTVALAATSAVRRLTPRECERLQGFPDDYTAIPWRKKPSGECPDGPRYKALGNSMAVPVMRWIGRRVANELAKRIAS